MKSPKTELWNKSRVTEEIAFQFTKFEIYLKVSSVLSQSLAMAAAYARGGYLHLLPNYVQ